MTNTKEQKVNNIAKPWYKEPWPWFLMLGPFVVVIAGFITYDMAASTQDTLVTDDYYKEGKYIHLQIERDQVAQKHKLLGQAHFNKDGSEIRIAMQGEFDSNAPITLFISHPTLAPKDQTVALKPIGGNMYEAKLKPLGLSKYWHIQVEDNAKTWRIQERWYPEQGNEVKLTSSLDQVNK